MYFLRALIILFSIPAFSFKSATLSVGQSDYNSKANAITLEENLRNNIFDYSLSLNQLKLNNNADLQIGFNSNTADYSRYIIYDFIGNGTPLAEKLNEKSLTLKSSIYLNNSTLELSASSNFRSTPLSKNAVSVSITNKLSNYSNFGFQLGYQNQSVPLSYFTNPNNNEREARPTQLISEKIDLFFEKIYTSNFKNKSILSYGRRQADRPDYWGLEFKNIFVLNDDWGFRFDIGNLIEFKNDSLKTDIGYQSSSWLETKLNYSLNSYWDLGFGYGLEVNREEHPWNATKIILSNDQILTDLKLSTSEWSVVLSMAIAKYNTGQIGQTLKGRFEWDF